MNEKVRMGEWNISECTENLNENSGRAAVEKRRVKRRREGEGENDVVCIFVKRIALSIASMNNSAYWKI